VLYYLLVVVFGLGLGALSIFVLGLLFMYLSLWLCFIVVVLLCGYLGFGVTG